jgi:3-deoxy-D-manno-octulosonic-acid transferase
LVILYNFFIRCYQFAVSIAAFWNPKARQWINGRKKLFNELEKQIEPSHEIIWMHCASAGEFEQGKPVIELLKNRYPNKKVLVSFFSPSGHAAGIKYDKADLVCYLPLDTKKNATHFLAIVKPQLVVFIKYEYWYHHLKTARENNIPLLLLSAIFREEQIFFKSFGVFHRKILQLYTKIFVQDDVSESLLRTINISCIVSGDTRFDRVIAIANRFKNNNNADMELIKIFALGSKALVAGSTWPEDEKIMAGILKAFPTLKLIIAPHEIGEDRIKSLEILFPNSIRYSRLKEKMEEGNVLIIDNVGLLSQIYQYATITYIGGGFNKSGIHNTLEAAVWGKPVIFGPNYKKFKEAKELIETGASFSISNANELIDLAGILLSDNTKLNNSGNAAKNYVMKKQGATEKIANYIQEKRLLTS